jgi:hypothetical protein
MSTATYHEVLEKVRELPDDEQLRLIADVAAALRAHAVPSQPARPQEYQEILVPGYDPTTDPLSRFVGMFHSGTPDLAERHDEYLAESYADTHEDKE